MIIDDRSKLGLNARSFIVKYDDLVKTPNSPMYYFTYKGRNVKVEESSGYSVKDGTYVICRLITNDATDYIGKPTEIEKAIKVLQKELSKDKSEGSYYYGWQSNIAMAFYDEFHIGVEGNVMKGVTNIKEIANNAAKRFLDNLIG